MICHDCKRKLKKGDEYMDYKNGFYKCKKCHKKDNVLKNYQRCEVYSRVVGYMRPVDSWNLGKKEEFKNRKVYKV